MNKAINYFVPFPFNKKELDLKCIKEKFEHEPIFASKGQYAIYHILQSYKIYSGKIAISAYMCSSVESMLLKNGYIVTHYDIDPQDLNPDVEDIKKVLHDEKPDAIVVASMYGNPADLYSIESLCKNNGVIMIDDAAQSFGARIGNKYVGSFGDGGFFSFYPGKPTAAHRGAYFWTNKRYEIKRSKHFLYSVICYESFKYNRYLAYENHQMAGLFWSSMLSMMNYIVDIKNDKECVFEKKIFGGVIDANFNTAYFYRKKWINMFLKSFEIMKDFKVIKAIRGIPNNSKIVLLFYERNKAKQFKNYLDKEGVSYFSGYKIPESKRMIKNAKHIEGRVVEFPIDPNEFKMELLMDKVSQFYS